MNIEVLKSKTVLASIVGLIASAVGVYLGDATAVQGVQTGLIALVGIFLRSAVADVGRRADAAAVAAQDAAAAAQGAETMAKSGAAEASTMPAAGER